jgi:DoxX-like family
MTATAVVVTVITVIINAYAGIANLIPARSVLANSAKVHVPRSWLPLLRMLKLAGAIGLVTALFGLPATASRRQPVPSNCQFLWMGDLLRFRGHWTAAVIVDGRC